MRMKKVSALLILVLVVSGGFVASLFILRIGLPMFFTETVDVEDGRSKPPQIIIRYQGASDYGAQGSYCWRGNCVDYVPLQSREDLDSLTPIKVVNGSEVSFKIEGYEEPEQYHVTIYGIGRSEYIWNGAVERSLKIELPSGTYLLDVFVSWNSGGDTSNIFKIEVVRE